MTAEEIQDFKNNIGNEVTFWGYTSCSLDESNASHFMWDDKETGHTKVLLNIYWGNKPGFHYFLNAGSYDYEDEVLLFDGVGLKVISVEEVKDIKSNHLYTKLNFEWR